MQRGLVVASVLVLAACQGKSKSSGLPPGGQPDRTAESDVWQMDPEAVPVGNRAPAPLHADAEDRAPPRGPLDKSSIKREVTANLDRFSACYEKRLTERPNLVGEIRVDFVIAQDGHVGSATGSGPDRELADCCARAIRTIPFPAPSAGTVSVSYPFVFKPS
jgi:hypothetical protein